MSYVPCPETITSPAPDYGFAPNEVCGAHCEVDTVSPLMQVMCPLGHTFFATEADVVEPSVR